MNAPALWLPDFPTHGVPSVKTDRSLVPFSERGTRPRKKKKKKKKKKEKKKLTSDRCPAWKHALHPPGPPPARIHTRTHAHNSVVSSSPRAEQECAVTVLDSGEPLAYCPREQHYTTCKKAKPIPSELTGGHTRLTNHLRVCPPLCTTGCPVWSRPHSVMKLLNHFCQLSHLFEFWF